MKKITFQFWISFLILVIGFSSCNEKDVNIPPVIEDQYFLINEYIEKGDFVGQIVANDPDSEDALTFKILNGNLDSAFNITSDGNLLISDPQVIDFEAIPVYHLEVEVFDENNSSSIASVFISVNDDEILSFDQSFEIYENSAPNTFVGKVICLSTNENSVLNFSIKDGNPENTFKIDTSSGTISVNSNTKLDYELYQTFALIIEIRNETDETITANITITVKDVQPTTSGLIAYFTFDNTFDDNSESKNDGISFTENIFVTGHKKQAIDFNGVSDYILLSKTLDCTEGLSFSFWLNSRGAKNEENNGMVLSKRNSAVNERSFFVSSFGSGVNRTDNKLMVAFYNDKYSGGSDEVVGSIMNYDIISQKPNASYWDFINPKEIDLNIWTHCLINCTTDSIETWLNGQLCVKKKREFNFYYNSLTEPTRIGNGVSGNGMNHLHGSLDELRIYDRGLSKKEILTLFKE